MRGFTLIELMVVLAIAVVLLTLALPQMGTMMAGNRLRVGGTDLMSALLLARSEAIKRNAQVAVSPTDGADWTQGWIVAAVATGEQYDKKNGLGAEVLITGAPAAIVYDANGRLMTVGATKVEFADVHGRAPPRCVAISLSGLPRVTHGGCA